MNKRLGFIYGLLVILLVLLGTWWVYFLAREGNVHAQFRRQQLASDSLHASIVLQTGSHVPVSAESVALSFPGLIIEETPDRITVGIDPAVLAEIGKEARATSNMFLYEGIFFLLLLAGGSALLVHSWHSELRFKRTRELFLAGATHEFKTPLASLRLYTETLDREDLAAGSAREIRRHMVEDIMRLESLVDNMLAMSANANFARGPRSRIDLGEECHAVAQDLAVFARDHGAVIEVQAPTGTTILGHHQTFVLALRNLVVNAIIHNTPPVQVRLEVAADEHEHRLTVRDNGSGIPRRLQDRVFDCFFSGTPAQGTVGGAGLGLYLVKRHAQELGGQIELVSGPDTGSAFTMVLPAQPNERQGGPA